MARLYAEAFGAAPSLADDLVPATATTPRARPPGRAAAGARTRQVSGTRRGHGCASSAATACRGPGCPGPRHRLRPNRDPRSRSVGVERWRNEPELSCVRDPGELDRLSADERKEYLTLWADVAALLARTER